jgi:hypothetical protein
MTEAMSCALPIASMAVASTRENPAATGAGVVVEQSDNRGLAGGATEQLLTLDDLTNMSGNAARIASERFGADRIIRSHEHLYDVLCRE